MYTHQYNNKTNRENNIHFNNTKHEKSYTSINNKWHHENINKSKEW